MGTFFLIKKRSIYYGTATFYSTATCYSPQTNLAHGSLMIDKGDVRAIRAEISYKEMADTLCNAVLTDFRHQVIQPLNWLCLNTLDDP